MSSRDRSRDKRQSQSEARLPLAPFAWPSALAGVTAGVWAFFIPLLFVFFAFQIAWIITADPTVEQSTASIASLAVLLNAMSVAISLGEVSFSLPPLLITFLLVWATARASRWAISVVRVTNMAGVLATGFTVAATYGLLGTITSLLLGSDIGVNSIQAFLFAFCWAWVGYIWALISSPGVVTTVGEPEYKVPGQRTTLIVKVRPAHEIMMGLWRDVPRPVRIGFGIGVRHFVVQTSMASILVALLAITRLTEVTSIVDLLADTSTDTFFVLLFVVLFIPTVIVWVSATLLGPGFMLGTDTTYTLFEQTIGALPALPFLAIFPASFSTVALALFLLPMIAGMVAPLRWIRRSTSEPFQLGQTLTIGFSAALSFSVTMMAAAAMASGAFGAGRYVEVGPDVIQIGLATGAWSIATFLVVVGLSRFLKRHDSDDK